LAAGGMPVPFKAITRFGGCVGKEVGLVQYHLIFNGQAVQLKGAIGVGITLGD